VIDSIENSTSIELSATLGINQRIRAEQARGVDIVHLGFGEARLPVPAAVAEALARATGENAYGAVTGEPDLRESVAAWLGRRGMPTEPDRVMVTPGSKAALYALLTVLPGDLVLPRPSWVSYAAQGHLLGKRIVWWDVPRSAGGIPDPARLEAEIESAVRGGLDPSILILTIPDNPTARRRRARRPRLSWKWLRLAGSR
jgi:aspartate aminotransferase